MRLDVKRQLFARSERVKGIDFHSTEPWILTTLYNGHAHIWSYETQAIIKTFELTDVPVRAGRFIERKNWIVCGSDDFQLRVVNWNTSEKVKSFEAHPDYIRAIVVHPVLSVVLTASDDMTIRMFDWEKDWRCNPKDTNVFASACLDRTIKIWSIDNPSAKQTIEAHEKGVNHIDYYPHSDKPYLLSTSDDKTVKVWDYTTKALIATLEGHTSNVSFACYHPELPVIISGSEDGTIKIWHANTYRLEQSLSYGLERAWCVSYQRGKQGVAMGFDDGAVVVKMGREEPAVSMDGTGKLVWARHNEVVSSIVKGGDASIKDGGPIALPSKDMGTTEIYPTTLYHSPNGRFVSVCGDGEFIIYTALAWRNQAFGSALDFAWASHQNPTDYAIRESGTSVKLFKKLKESGSLDVGFQAEGLCGGFLLGVKGQGGIGMFDWETGNLVRRIEVEPREVYWSESGELVALACADMTYVLRFDREAYLEGLNNGEADEDGVEAAFSVVTDLQESVKSGEWVGDAFLFTTNTRLSYLLGEQVVHIAQFDQPMYLLRYLQRDERVYLCDKDVNAVSYRLSTALLSYQTLVLRGEIEAAQELLPEIPADQMNKIARFLEAQGHKELALEVATDPEHRFELALGLNNLAVALEIARESDMQAKWSSVADKALELWDLKLAEECFLHAKDLGSLLLLYTSSGNQEGLSKLAQQAEEMGSNNVAFASLWTTGDVSAAIELLKRTGRLSEAVLFSQTYKPSKTKDLVLEWKESLDKQGKSKVSRLLGVPGQDEELFPEWVEYIKLEQEGGSVEPKTDLIDVDGDEEPATNGTVDDEPAAEDATVEVDA
ncbi:Coatomer subunit beta' [Exophiala xenobiotica]|nr:Coatomer subunit beta' [Exophiala xenobiotica]KAK5448622.1 Coatomer subunit beta' [Exophiala xenobiotica]